MGVEIERKFLVDHDAWRKLDKPEGTHYEQGYILSDNTRTVRIRIAGNHSYITLKGAASGITRSEHEYEIPLADGKELLKTFTTNSIKKIRYCIPLGDFIWEVDEFHGDNEGLIVAEIELKSEQDIFEKPTWVTSDVTDDYRYANSNLVVHPFKDWQ